MYRDEESKNFTAGIITLCVLFTLLSLVWSSACGLHALFFQIRCQGHIERAGYANTVELAEKELQTVVDYLDSRGWHEGYTSIVYKTPDEDVGFWYQNLKSSLDELKKVGPSTTQLEKSNILIKLRESLTDRSKGSTRAIVPPGIYLFPHNTGYCGWGIISWLGCILTWMAVMAKIE